MADNRRERLKFLVLYAQIVQAPLNPAEFDADNQYAFQAFERALHSEHQELVELATKLQAQRQAKIESAAVPPRLDATYKMPTLTRLPEYAPAPDAMFAAAMAAAAEAAVTGTHSTITAPSGHPAYSAEPELPTAAAAQLDFSTTIASAVEAVLTGGAGAASAAAPEPAAAAAPEATPAAATAPEAAPAAAPAPAPAPEPTEKRSGATRLTPPQLAQVVNLERLYRGQFGVPLDVAEFMLNDDYGRAVIERSRGASSSELAALAYGYLDAMGEPLIHRRRSQRRPADGPGSAESQTLTLVCDGTTQTLGDFRGIGTYCLVNNAEFSSTVAVAVKGIKQALLAPGYAIACRTVLVRVKGPAGAVVELDFVGLRDLVG